MLRTVLQLYLWCFSAYSSQSRTTFTACTNCFGRRPNYHSVEMRFSMKSPNYNKFDFFYFPLASNEIRLTESVPNPKKNSANKDQLQFDFVCLHYLPLVNWIIK